MLVSTELVYNVHVYINAHTHMHTHTHMHMHTHTHTHTCSHTPDVKPSNILINKAGEVKLCDFGIAGELVNSFCQTDIGCKPYLAVSRTHTTHLMFRCSVKCVLSFTVYSRRGLTPKKPERNTIRDQMYGVMESPW